MKRVESLLRNRIGLDSASVGSSLIERAVRLRMRELGVSKADDYLEALEVLPEEWNELIEAVVVTETWFFRDREPFPAFVKLVEQEWLPANPGKTLRILSVPCSTGEEPYSLAMALVDAGVPRNQFTIEAIDLSARALERAKRGLYGKNSFRGKALEFRARHFFETEAGFSLRKEICECVQFDRGNLLDANFFEGRAGYDFVFCRNLLIYFDRATQARALKQLHAILGPSGVLFVGPAEMPLISGQGFASANLPMAFACRKVAVTAAPAPARRDAPKKAPRPLPEVSPKPVTPKEKPAAKPAATRLAPQPVSNDLMTARELADAGKLDEAAALCEAHLKSNGPSAQGFYLLGLVRDAAGDANAIHCYRKALYLEPDHYETLLQLALLLEKNGEAEEARTLKRRAQRVQQKGGNA